MLVAPTPYTSWVTWGLIIFLVIVIILLIGWLIWLHSMPNNIPFIDGDTIFIISNYINQTQGVNSAYIGQCSDMIGSGIGAGTRFTHTELMWKVKRTGNRFALQNVMSTNFIHSTGGRIVVGGSTIQDDSYWFTLSNQGNRAWFILDHQDNFLTVSPILEGQCNAPIVVTAQTGTMGQSVFLIQALLQ